MSVRKTKIISFNVSSGTFKSLDEAIKEANAIKIWLQRLCEKKGYSCKAVIGVSKHNPRVGQIKAIKTGRRGRPAYEFERTSKLMIPAETEAHLHLIIYANPGEMICCLLKKHLNNKYKRNVVWFNDCSKYVHEVVDYVLRQSLKLRKIETDNSNILDNDDFGFYSAVDNVNKEQENIRITFTYNRLQEIPSRVNIKALVVELRERKTLQCNPYIKIYTNNIYTLYAYSILTNKIRRYNVHTLIYMICIYLHIRRVPP